MTKNDEVYTTNLAIFKLYTTKNDEEFYDNDKYRLQIYYCSEAIYGVLSYYMRLKCEKSMKLSQNWGIKMHIEWDFGVLKE